MAKKSLFPHQLLAIRHLHEWYREFSGRASNGYLEMPTGSGKTRTAVESLAPLLKGRKRILWIAHSGYLLNQAMGTMKDVHSAAALGSVGELVGRRKEFDRDVTFASVQTLCSRDLAALSAYCDNGKPDLTIFDEFHRAAADEWKKSVKWLSGQGVPILGLSATPTRTDHAKKHWLHKNFPHCVFRVGMTELITGKVLARPTVYRVEVKGPRLEWTAEELRHARQFKDVPESVLKRIAGQEERNRLVIKTFKSHPKVNKALVFCCSVDHAKSLADRFEKSGVRALSVTGKADSPENQEALEAFRDGDVQVLTSVVLLTEGVDLPACDSVMLARPTQSEILLKQMVGRAMRGRPSGGSDECTVIDFVDAFENVNDVSGTSLAFMREYEHGVDEVLRRPPSKRDRTGKDLALLLRLRDWLTEQYQQQSGGRDLGRVLIQEVQGVLAFFDQTSGVNRAVLVRKEVLKDFKGALQEVHDDLNENPEEWKTAIGAAAATRRIYADHFRDDERLSEEDFTSVVAEATRKDRDGDMTMLKPKEMLEAVVSSEVLSDPAVKSIQRDVQGLLSLMGLLE